MTILGGTRLSSSRALAAVTAVLVAAALLTLVPTPRADSAPGALTLKWSVSSTFGKEFTKALDFAGGTGTFHPGSGEVSVSYPGTVESEEKRLLNLGKPKYGLTVTDPSVTVDFRGRGALTAKVSSFDDPNKDGTPDTITTPKRVLVTTFTADGESWTSSASGVGTLAGAPTAWAPAFLGQLTPLVRAHFEPSTDPARTPAAFTAQADEQTVTEPTLEADVLGADGDSVRVLVRGLGYLRAGLPVSVAIGRSGQLPWDLVHVFKDNVEDAAFMGSQKNAWAMRATIDRALFDPTLDYSAYTWEGAVRQTSRLDAEAPFALDLPPTKLRPTRTRLGIIKQPTTRHAGKVRVRVVADRGVPQGVVRLVWTDGRTKRVFREKLTRFGIAYQRLGSNRKGRWTLRATYGGSGVHARSTRFIVVRVRR